MHIAPCLDSPARWESVFLTRLASLLLSPPSLPPGDAEGSRQPLLLYLRLLPVSPSPQHSTDRAKASCSPDPANGWVAAALLSEKGVERTEKEVGVGGRLTEGSASRHFSSCSSSLKWQQLERLQCFPSMLHSPQTWLEGHKLLEPVWPPSYFFIDKYRHSRSAEKGRRRFECQQTPPASNQQLMKTLSRKVIQNTYTRRRMPSNWIFKAELYCYIPYSYLKGMKRL